jgi:hypothetical protein
MSRRRISAAPVAAEVLEPRELLTATVASHLVILSSPTSGTACGAGHNLGPQYKFALESASGKVVTSDNSSTVTLSVVKGPWGYDEFGPCSFPSMPVQQGELQFSQVTFYVAGKYTVKATDSSGLSVTLPPVTIVAGPAEQLAMTAPSTAEAGRPLGTVTVSVEDKYGNVVTGDNSSVVSLGLYANGNTTTPIATYQATVVDGVATFKGIVAPAAENYRLSATVSSLPPSFGGVGWSQQAGIEVA